MPASPLPRTARTGRTNPTSRTARTGAAALTALTLAGTALLGAPAAFAAPGDNGDVKIHADTTPDADQRNNPKVCQFYLAAFNFDRGQGVTWIIEPQPAERGSATLTGTLALPTGTGRTTGLLALPDGQYKLTWQIVDGKGAGKHKVFKVDCKKTRPPAGPRTRHLAAPTAAYPRAAAVSPNHRACRRSAPRRRWAWSVCRASSTSGCCAAARWRRVGARPGPGTGRAPTV